MPMSERKSLLFLSKEILKLEHNLIMSEGLVDPELERQLEISEINFPQKVDSYAAVLDRLDISEEWANKQIQQFKDFLEGVKRAREGLKFRLNRAMDLLEKTELEGEHYIFTQTWGSGKVEILDEDVLDKHYQRVTYTPNKKKIAEDLKAGLVVDGAILIKERSVKKSIKR